MLSTSEKLKEIMIGMTIASFIFIFILLFIIVTNLIRRELFSNRFREGECVRELGHFATEKIITSIPNGGIETEYISNYGNVTREIYNKQKQETLIKIDCPQ
jgi:hypothetical protein